MLQMFVSSDPSEFFNVSVHDLNDTDQSTYNAVVTKEGMQSILPEGAIILSHKTTKLDGETCGMVECVYSSERAGLKLEMHSIFFALPFKGKLIILTGSSGGLSGSSDLAAKFAMAKPRLIGIAASLVLKDKWNQLTNTTVSQLPDGYKQLQVVGIELVLPGDLTNLSEEKASGGQIESMKKLTCVSGTRSVIIKQFQFQKPFQMSALEASEMTEQDLKKESGFSSTKRNFSVDGIKAIRLDATWQKSGAQAKQSVLFFSRENILWEVHLFGVNEPDMVKLDEMKDAVFQSIRVLK